MSHPDELLAQFVEGTASTTDREAVEAHLATCGRCRDEVGLAHAARAALASLPQLGAPGLAAAGLESFRRAALQPVPSIEADTGPEAIPRVAPPVRATPQAGPAPAPSPTPAPARHRVHWAQLAAVAAVVVLLAGVVAIPLLLSRGGGSSKTTLAPGAPSATSPPPPLIDREASYTTQQLDQLAASIALNRAAVEGAGRGAASAPLPPVPSVPTGPAIAAADSVATKTALDCVTSGAGLQPQDRAVPVYLEEADVVGTPAYVGAFQLPDVKLNLLLIAVSRDGCQPLYNVRQSI